MHEFEDMVTLVQGWFRKETEQRKKEFLSTPKEKLEMYHSSLGRSIRNEFKLWDNEWVPVIQDGTDCSPDHPDQVSMKVIETVWERLQSS